jgi:hypothetical protein
MQINLKQPEIMAALRAYISNQGISLANKEVTISFTAGRKESGLSAEITIEELPQLPELVGEVVAPKLTVVQQIAVAREDLELKEEVTREESEQPMAAATAEAPAPKSPSLFA